MIKLMVVDDEVNIRKGLREYITWDAWGIELVAEAENAENALEIAVRVKPDILLTDIRMDKMNGIELTRRLKEMFPDLRVILLSGYSDVEYLQAALQIKAAEYLLKPAGADKIIEVVLRLKKEILEERQKWQENLRRDAFLDENIPIIQMHFINEVMKGKIIESKMIQNKAEILNIPMQGNMYAVMLLDARKNLFEDGYKSGQELDMNFWKFMQKMNGVIQNYKDAFWCEMEEAVFLILLNAKNRETILDKSNKMAAELLRVLVSSRKGQIYIGIGKVVDTPVQLCESFKTAENALLLSAWNPEQYILFDSRGVSEDKEQFCSSKEREVIADIASAQYEKAFQELNNLFECYEEIEMDFRKVKKFCRELCMLIIHFTSEQEKDEETEIPVIDDFRDAKNLRDWMIQFLERCFNSGESAATQYSQLTKKTIRYIQSHYNEDITLQSLSKIVFVSPNYLGKVFFSDVGCRMSDWLNRYRVEQAKELLISTDKKTYEIAEEVGFSGYKYFSICFLKYVGCSAREYRNKYRKS